MRARLRFALLLTPFLPVHAPARAQEPAELRWTLVRAPDLDRFEGSAGSVRVSNLILERKPGTDPAGAATEFEFSASLANRSQDRLRVSVQIVGVKRDGSPSVIAEDAIWVDGRRNESIRVTVNAPEQVSNETAAFYVHALASP